MKFVIPRRIDWDRWTLVNVTIEAVEVVHDLEASKKSQLETQLTANELKFLVQQINKRAAMSSNHEWIPYRIKDIINAPKASGLYLVSMKYPENPKPITYVLFYDTYGEYWMNSMGEDFEKDGSEVFAWRALPEPYDETEDRK